MNTKIFGIVLLVFGALGALASGFSIQANPDYIVLHGTEAKVFVSATNDGPAGSISFSVDSGELTASVVSPVQSAAAGETKGTYVTVNAPDCFRGSGDIEITAQLASGGNAAYDSKIVHVMVYPTEQCDQYTDSAPAGGQYVPAGSVPAVLFTSYADPAEYRVGVLGGERPVALGPSQFKRVTLKIINYGAAADFELRVFGDSLNAFLDKESVSLQRSEAADVHLDVRPAADAELARHFATVQVLAQNQVVYEKDVAFDVSVRHDIRLVLPTSIIKSDGTKPVAVQAALQNAGTGAEVLKITTSASASAPATVSVAPGETKKFIVLVDVTKLVPGENPVEIRAENDFVEGSGKVIVSFAAGESEFQPIPVIVAVKNDADEPLEDVTGSVTGIPSSWAVMKGEPITVPAHGEANLTLFIKPATNEDAYPVLTVKSGDRVLQTVKLPPIKAKSSGLSGFFTAFGSNTTAAIAALIVVAFVVALMASRARMADEREEHLKRLESVRAAVRS